MSILDLFVSTSFSEGMSNTILEAMACGIPIVATDVGDSGKLVEDGGNGFMVKSEDRLALEKAIKLLLSDNKLRQSFGLRSRAIAEEKYDIMKMVSRYQEIYLQSIMNKRVIHDL
jgi:glycosyltransferase involved in cell wall biosynthesis